MSLEGKEVYIKFLKQDRYVFALTFSMSGLDPAIAMHRLTIVSYETNCKAHASSEVDKLVKVIFIIKVQYPIWLEIIMPIKKKNREFQVCVNFRDLNKACPKDDFAVPHMELLINATTGYEALSFMDVYLVYYQTKMHPEEEEMTMIGSLKRVILLLSHAIRPKHFFLHTHDDNLEGYASRYGEMP